MSGRTETATGDAAHGSLSRLAAAVQLWLPVRKTARTAAVGAALAVSTARLLVTLLHNAPFDPLTVPVAVRAGLAALTPAVLGLGLVTVALTAERPTVRVGALTAGVFGPLAAVDSSATLPAVLGVCVGGTLALAGTVGRPTSYLEARPAVVAAGFALAVAVSLGSATGLLGGGQQSLGVALALGSLAATGLLGSYSFEGRKRYLPALAGVAGFGLVAATGASSPYLLGSVLLVGFGVVGVTHLLFALGVAGVVAAVASALGRGALVPALGAALLLVAGVPATMPRAMAVLLGAVVLLADPALSGRGNAEEVAR